MKPDHLTAEVMAYSYRQHRTDFLSRLARWMSRKVRQSGWPVSTLPLNLNHRRILNDFFKQELGLESRSKDHEGDRKAVFLQNWC